MISVALCTYNGEKYLPEQLDSILHQSVLVDELVVCDDGSKDNTLIVLEKFAQKASFPIRVFQNETNLGSTRNFEKCLSLCEGEFILLSDQDDIWRNDRVEKQIDYLHTHPEIDAVFSNAIIIDNDSQPTQVMIWDEIEFTEHPKKRWKDGKAHEILFGGFVVTGATVALRSSCLRRLMPFPVHVPKMIHDAWIALVLSLEKKIDFIDEPLIYYRMHESQQVGFGAKVEPVRLKDRFQRDRSEKLAPIQEKADDAHQIYLLLQKLSFVPQEKLAKLASRQKHYQQRATLPDNRLRRLPLVLKEALTGRYQYSSKDWWLPALGDLLE